jgi:hypothetical protein
MCSDGRGRISMDRDKEKTVVPVVEVGKVGIGMK